ncbi:hypothetical protein [Methanimicrococcus hongohii]|uniref:hypothetical protein n=1 Tax=Methanimicrococcus hongohii TaxID=3028295 RepID=UPI00292CB713|nr:hypothetical protein [Methanimicrococcus sp. Hf6]
MTNSRSASGGKEELEILSHTKRKMRNSQLFHRCSAPANAVNLQLSFTDGCSFRLSLQVCNCLLMLPRPVRFLFPLAGQVCAAMSLQAAAARRRSRSAQFLKRLQKTRSKNFKK